MRENALPILEAGGVDLVLAGHSHVYERSFLLDSHYGKSDTLTPVMRLDRGDGSELGDGAYVKQAAGPAAHEGAIYVVAGSSGRVSQTSAEHPAMSITLESLGSMVIDIDGDRLDARFLDDEGEVRDRFTLLKGVERMLTRDEPRVSLATGGTQNLFMDAGFDNAAKFYQVAGSFGTSPGFELDSVHVPLNRDRWFEVSLSASNSAVYQNTGGMLDLNGRAQAAIVVPSLNDPSLIGLVLHHAFVTHDSTRILMASNPVKLTLTQ